MIDSNNQFKKLSHSLINSVRDIMEATKEGGIPKTDKHKDLAAKAPPHDKITHADVLVGRGVLKKHPTTGKLVTKEEVEEIDELSRKTLGSYVKKASTSAANKASEYGTKKAEADEMDRMMNRHMSFSDKDKVRDIMKTNFSDYEKPREKAGRRIKGINRAVDKLTKEESGLDLARTVLNNIRNEIAEGVEGIDEAQGPALDAASRYSHHHTAIKDLLKSIDHHVRNHKVEALKHKDYRGKTGINWGLVGDLAHVHSQLADIHDRFAQQGEYKKSMSESIDESAKSDTHWFSVRGMKDEHLDKLNDMTVGQDGPGHHLEYGENHGRPTFVVGINSKHKNHAATHAFLKKHATPWTKPPRDVNEDVDQIDELSKKTLGSYIKEAGSTSLNSAGYHMHAAGRTRPYDSSFSNKAWKKGVKRASGVALAADKIVKESPVDGVAPGSMDNNGHLCATKVFHKEWAEGVPIFSQHAEPDANGNIAWYDVMFEHGIEKGVWTEDLEILMTESHERHGKRRMKEENELDEARGRPRKNPLPPGKNADPNEVEARMHIIQQLERAKLSMRGGEPVSFMDGTKHTVHSPDANKIIMKYHSMKPFEKEIFQKKIHASHAGLKAEL